MVRAILDGIKTQTRRVVTAHTSQTHVTRARWPLLEFDAAWVDHGPSPAGNPGPYLHVPLTDEHDTTVHRVYPRLQVGDVLYVRETWGVNHRWDCEPPRVIPPDTNINYRATWDGPCGLIWRPSIHMPRWASRITLEVLDVRVERVQDISSTDCIAEGIQTDAEIFNFGCGVVPHDMLVKKRIVYRFESLWNSINAKRGYDFESSPWVWVLTFKRIGKIT